MTLNRAAIVTWIISLVEKHNFHSYHTSKYLFGKQFEFQECSYFNILRYQQKLYIFSISRVHHRSWIKNKSYYQTSVRVITGKALSQYCVDAKTVYLIFAFENKQIMCIFLKCLSWQFLPYSLPLLCEYLITNAVLTLLTHLQKG